MIKENKKPKYLTIDFLKKEVANYYNGEKIQEELGWEFFIAGSKDYYLKDFETTKEFIKQMSKEEFDIIIQISDDIISKFKNLELIQIFLEKYNKYYSKTECTDPNILNEINFLKKYTNK